MEKSLYEQIKSYIPWNEQEEADREEILRALLQEDIFLRSSRLAHITASAWTVNRARNQVLMAYHNIYHSWSWLGGHADGEKDLLSVAIREVQEESGIRSVVPVSEEIFSLEVLTVDGHEKKGVYVPSHLHLNITYLLEADDGELLTSKPDENSAVAWFSPKEAVAASTETWFQERIYEKLNQKLTKWVRECESL